MSRNLGMTTGEERLVLQENFAVSGSNGLTICEMLFSLFPREHCIQAGAPGRPQAD